MSERGAGSSLLLNIKDGEIRKGRGSSSLLYIRDDEVCECTE